MDEFSRQIATQLGSLGVASVFAYMLLTFMMKQYDRQQANLQEHFKEDIKNLAEIRDAIKSQIQAQVECHKHIEYIVEAINKR